jgi:transcriptional regulator with XRE-family HTH domain
MAARAPTANQVVAHRLREARELRGLSQPEVAARLHDYGIKWAKTDVSAAERSADPAARRRNFDADQLVAFAAVFDLPLAWFFVPPAGVGGVRPQGAKRAISAANAVELLSPTTDLHVALVESGHAEAAEAQRQLIDHYVMQALGDVAEAETTLRNLADRFSSARLEVAERLRRAYEQPKEEDQ